MADDDDDFLDELSFTERWILGIIVGALILVALIIYLDPASWDWSFGLGGWGLQEWATVLFIVLIVGTVALSIFMYSEDPTPEDAFINSRGFLYTIGAFGVIVLLLNSGLIGIFEQGDSTQRMVTNAAGQTLAVPDDYVDYGTPQPYGYGTYGPADEGLLTGGQGALVGCGTGGVSAWALAGWVDGPLPFADILGFTGGCIAGAVAGYGISESDFDGDPTTGL